MPMSPTPRLRYATIALLACAALAGLWLSHNRKQFHNLQGSVWTTDYHITYEHSRVLDDSVQLMLQRVDNSASMYNPTSLLSRLNANEIDTVDDILARLYTASQQVYSASGEAFDPTVLPLVEAWGFARKGGPPPTQQVIDSLLAIVGFHKTALHGRRLSKQDSRIRFDFSSIAKGLACDEVGRMLHRNGVSNFLVEIGGEVMACGSNPRGGQWHVSVDLPTADTAAVDHHSALVLALDSGAVATSGSYRKWREVDGQRVSHIVDPRTGQASVSHLLSVTVLAADCMTADAWATACMVMGGERVIDMMENRTDLGVMTISTDEEGNYIVWSNARFAQCVVQTP